ncbi:TERF1-interacting nuclear factor 2-like [Aplochiton taeniatus]
MNLQLFDALIADTPLSLSSLRLLVTPLQLMCASMWQVVKQQDVMNYWKVAEFVSLVTEMVPELLICKHRAQLILGMKARHILELCRSEYFVDPKIVTSHLDRIRLLSPTSENVSEANFIKLVQTLLKDSEENEHFFKDVFSAEYGSQYDKDLQTLFWEFLCRLAQLVPPPNLQQVN